MILLKKKLTHISIDISTSNQKNQTTLPKNFSEIYKYLKNKTVHTFVFKKALQRPPLDFQIMFEKGNNFMDCYFPWELLAV